MLFLDTATQKALMPARAELFQLVEDGVRLASRNDVVVLPTTGLPTNGPSGGTLYSVRATCPSLNLAMVKTVGAYGANRALGLPPNPGVAVLHDAQTGMPLALFDASFLTTLRTAAQVAWSALKTCRAEPKVLGVIGARGIAPFSARLIADALDLDDIRIASRDLASAERAAEELNDGQPGLAKAVAFPADAVRGADIVVDGPGLVRHSKLFTLSDVRAGAAVVSFGAFSSFDVEAFERVSGTIVDRWVASDTGETGALGPLIASGRVQEGSLRALLPDIAAGQSSARNSDSDILLVGLRGLATCDITLAQHMLATADKSQAGLQLAAENDTNAEQRENE